MSSTYVSSEEKEKIPGLTEGWGKIWRYIAAKSIKWSFLQQSRCIVLSLAHIVQQKDLLNGNKLNDRITLRIKQN